MIRHVATTNPMRLDSSSSLLDEPVKLHFLDYIFGSKSNGLPNIFACFLNVLTISFITQKITDSRDSYIQSETTFGILAGLILGSISSLGYNTSCDDVVIAVAFIAMNLTVVTMVSSVIHLLILFQLESDLMVKYYIKSLGSYGSRLTGQLLVSSIIFWIAATCLNLFYSTSAIWYFIIPCIILFL